MFLKGLQTEGRARGSCPPSRKVAHPLGRTQGVTLLDWPDVFGPRSFRTLPFGKRHALSFMEFFVSHPFEIRHVEEHVLAGACVDKSKALVRQPLNRTFSHSVQSPKKVTLRRCPTSIGQPTSPRAPDSIRRCVYVNCWSPAIAKTTEYPGVAGVDH